MKLFIFKIRRYSKNHFRPKLMIYILLIYILLIKYVSTPHFHSDLYSRLLVHVLCSYYLSRNNFYTKIINFATFKIYLRRYNHLIYSYVATFDLNIPQLSKM